MLALFIQYSHYYAWLSCIYLCSYYPTYIYYVCTVKLNFKFTYNLCTSYYNSKAVPCLHGFKLLQHLQSWTYCYHSRSFFLVFCWPLVSLWSHTHKQYLSIFSVHYDLNTASKFPFSFLSSRVGRSNFVSHHTAGSSDQCVHVCMLALVRVPRNKVSTYASNNN